MALDILANFVRVQLAQDFEDTDTEFRVQEPVAPYQLPPAPAGGEQARVTFMTDLFEPQGFEIVTYTGRTDNGDGTFTYTGIARGAEGTAVRPLWKAGAEVIQQPTAGLPFLSRWPSWDEVSAKPATFPPETHTHDWGDIQNTPAEATRWPDWTEVTGKPATFPPDAHTHAWADITDPPAEATRWPTWDEVTSKPSTFPPSAHTHVLAEITDAGSMAGQAANNVAITGGAIDGTPIGGSTRAGGYFTQLGIGTGSPSAPLDVLLNGAGLQQLMHLQNTGGDVKWRLGALNGAWEFSTINDGADFKVSKVGSGTNEAIFRGTGGFEFRNSSNTVAFAMNTAGELFAHNLPSADPSESGALWNDAGTVKVSAG